MSSAKKHYVIGTAGHIDHGKTSLVRALTGTETDRLPEEKKRGITIELGFAQWHISDDVTCSIIDVPGHEKFVRTMVAGAAGIDAVILVVAADDAVMPQTREHLAVCSLLGVKTGVVALTKTDLVDEEMLELVALDVEESLANTFLQGAPIVRVDSLSGRGIEELQEAVLQRLASINADADDEGSAKDFPHLGIDRIFSRAGFGTVVTGTLVDGALSVGDSVDLIPGRRSPIEEGVKIRGLEVHGDAVEKALAGRRCAVNLRGIEPADVVRGAVICRAKSRAPTRAVHVELTLLDGAPNIRENDELSLHLGTVDQLVRAVPLDVKEVVANSTARVRLKSDSPFFAYAGARFVVRKPGLHGQGTIGGGRVLDPHPTEGKGAFARWKLCSAGLASENLDDNVGALLQDARNEGLSVRALAARLPPHYGAADIAKAAENIGAAAVVVDGESRFVESKRVDEVASDILRIIETFHQEHPLLTGPSPREFNGKIPGIRGLLSPAAIQRLVATGDLVVDEAVVRHQNHQVQEDVLSDVASIFSVAKLAPPSDGDVQKKTDLNNGDFADALTELKRTRRLALVGGLHFDISTLNEVATKVRSHLGGHDSMATADLKEIAGGISRKFAIPLLEWLDKEGVTKRQGDVRVLA